MLKVFDFSVLMAYVCIVLSFVLCLVYGLIHWNCGADISQAEAVKERLWDSEEKSVEHELGGQV